MHESCKNTLEMKQITVEEEYLKNKHIKKEDVLTLMEWAKKQSHLPEVSELTTIFFLNSCNNSLQQSKTAIENYYTYKTIYTDFFSNWNTLDEKIVNAMNVCCFQQLTSTTKEKFNIIFIKFINNNPSAFNLADQIKIFLMTFQLNLLQYGTSEGHVILVDFSNITKGHVLKLNPLTIKRFFFFLQEAIPLQLKGFYFFDCVPFFDKFNMILKPFIKAEMLNFYPKEKIEDLYKIIPVECFPEDYGGKYAKVAYLHEQMKSNLKENVNLLKKIEQTERTNEQLRQGASPKGKMWSRSDSFRRLDID